MADGRDLLGQLDRRRRLYVNVMKRLMREEQDAAAGRAPEIRDAAGPDAGVEDLA